MSTYTEQDCLNKISEIDASRDECIRVLNEKNLEVPDNTKLEDLPGYIHNIVEGKFTTLNTLVTTKLAYGEEIVFTCPDNYDGYTEASIKFSISDERVILYSSQNLTDSRNYYIISGSSKHNKVSIHAGNNYFPANTAKIVLFSVTSLSDYLCRVTNKPFKRTVNQTYDGKYENTFTITN